VNALLNHVWGRSPAQDRVWAQVACMGPQRAVQRLFMALNFQAFMDESESKYEFVLGGYIQTAEIWANFAKDWEELLPLGTRAKNGRDHFKMSEMAYYGKWDETSKFYSIIERHDLVPISYRMNMDDFRKARESMQNFADYMRWNINWGLWNNPWYFSFRILLNEFHLKKEIFEELIPLTEKIDFYFDERSEIEPIIAAWSEIRRRTPQEIEKYFGANPRFENDQEFLGLQAADFWAWWVRRWYEEDSPEWPDLPEKLKQFDFGNWQGKKRKTIKLNMGEKAILHRFKGMAIENIYEGNVDPMTLAALKREFGAE
jgi:hypothetical protein